MTTFWQNNQNFSFVKCFWDRFVWGVTFHWFLVIRCKICSLLVAEVARYKKSLVTRFKKITRYSIQILLVTRCKKSLVTRCKKSLVIRFKICSLFVAEVARCKIRLFLVAEVESLFANLLSDSSTDALLWILMQNFKITYCVKHLRTTSSENNIKTSTNIYSFYLMSINLFTSI